MKKFFDKPYNWFMERYIWYKYRNRPYLEFYKALMEYRTPRGYKDAVGGNWDKIGQLQFERLIEHGMKPEDKLFDFGCGALRGGIHSIKYLNGGNYTGNDISVEILKAAKQNIEKEGLRGKNPFLYQTTDLDFGEVIGNKYDFIMAQSVLSHMPPEDIDTLFKNIVKIMHKNTIFLATFFLSDDSEIQPSPTYKNYAYPLEWMIQTGKKYNLNIDLADKDSKQKLMKITLSA